MRRGAKKLVSLIKYAYSLDCVDVFLLVGGLNVCYNSFFFFFFFFQV